MTLKGYNKMKVKCIYNEARQLSKEVIQSTKETIESTYWAKVGWEYDVFGILIKESRTLFLVDPLDNASPNWFLSNIFEIIDNKIPEDWKFFLNPNINEDLKVIIGYPSLIDNTNFHYLLEDRDVVALYEFRKYLVEYRKNYSLGR
jgi:hypothetical protein